MLKIKRIIPSISWLFIILFLSGYPGNRVPKIPIWEFDKLVHAGIYLVLSLLLLIAYQKQYSNKNTRLIILLIIAFFCVFYGGLMEILQHYIFINRSGNFYDFAANTFGTILGIILYPFVRKLLYHK